MFIWLFLSLTLPFGIYENNFSSFLLMSAWLSIFGISWTLLSYFIEIISIKFNVREHYKRDAVFWLIRLFVFIHLIVIVRGLLCEWVCIDALEYLESWLAGVLFMCFTYMPFSFYARFMFYKPMATSEETEELIVLKGEGKESLKISPDRIMYIQSDDNYVDIHVDEKEAKGVKVLRSTLASVEEQLSGYTMFVRVHRSYIVNLKFAVSIESKDVIRLKSESIEAEVPISKKYREGIQRLFG